MHGGGSANCPLICDMYIADLSSQIFARKAATLLILRHASRCSTTTYLHVYCRAMRTPAAMPALHDVSSAAAQSTSSSMHTVAGNQRLHKQHQHRDCSLSMSLQSSYTRGRSHPPPTRETQSCRQGQNPLLPATSLRRASALPPPPASPSAGAASAWGAHCEACGASGTCRDARPSK